MAAGEAKVRLHQLYQDAQSLITPGKGSSGTGLSSVKNSSGILFASLSFQALMSVGHSSANIISPCRYDLERLVLKNASSWTRSDGKSSCGFCPPGTDQ